MVSARSGGGREAIPSLRSRPGTQVHGGWQARRIVQCPAGVRAFRPGCGRRAGALTPSLSLLTTTPVTEPARFDPASGIVGSVDDWEVVGHPLYGPFQKLARAKAHFDVLRPEVEGFIESEPYRWWTEYVDYESGLREYAVSAEVLEDPPRRWGLILGDVVQNLRASLDHLVWAIADRELRDATTSFPIEIDKAGWRGRGRKRVEAVAGAALELIERVQPFHLGDAAKSHPLAVLQALSNIDKHRTLLPVGLVRRHEFVAGYGEFRVKEFTYLAPEDGDPFGDEVMRFTTEGEPDDSVNMKAYLSFHVAVEGRSLDDIEGIFMFVGGEILNAFDRS